MKRALAERAKQSGLPIGGGVGSLSSSDDVGRAALGSGGLEAVQQPPDQPLLKIARIDTPRSILSSSTTTPTTTTMMNPAAASPRALVVTSSSAGSSKRQRDSLTIATGPSGGDVEEDDSNFSAFYLRHQNRALASELSSLKYQLSHLKRERDYRRTQCQKACQSLNSLQATWTQIEAALQLGQQPPPHHLAVSGTALGSEWAHRNNRTNDGEEDDAFTCPQAGPPLSTGLGKSVELIDALLDALAALGNSPLPPSSREGKSRRRRRGHGDEEDEDRDMDDSSSVDSSESHSSESYHDSNAPIDNVERQQLDDLLGISDNVTQRADTLQRWIWSLLELLEKQGSSGNSENGAVSFSFPPDPSRIPPINKISSKLAREEAKTKRLKAQLKEVARARDEMQASDKRVRRGLYRLAAGRMPLTEVLKAIESSDEDKEAAVAWMEAGTTGGGQGGVGSPPGQMLSSGPGTTMVQPVSVGSSTSLMPSTELSGSMNPEPVMDAQQIAQLQRRQSESEQVAAAREEQIQKVRYFRLWLIDYFPALLLVLFSYSSFCVHIARG
jgi:E3 ubiquitin-protein ligase BRE1